MLLAAGCIYLAWLGVAIIVRRGMAGTGDADPRRLPEGFVGLCLFQFLNPKGWVLMATLASALPATPRPLAYAQIAALFLVMSLGCLGAWAALGRLFAAARLSGHDMGWFERLMGGLLVASAVLLLFGK
jgi:threonine/homoserine/homoserine lactone efflux protein